MRYSASITVWQDAEVLYRLFLKEAGDRKRSGCKAEIVDGKLVFEVNALDSVALRATLTGITQMLSVYEKMKDV